MRLVVDGDMTLYRAACACEQEIKWNDDVWTLHTTESDMQSEVYTFLETITTKLKSDDVYMVFSPSTTFRHRLFPAYKANRKNKRKPLGFSALKKWCLKEFNATVAQDMEADDLIGILCTRDPANTVAVSGDKDFGTLPIKWYNHLKKSYRQTSEEDATKFHLVQTMAGDSTDGYSGIKGVGVKTAERILEKEGYNWNTVVDAYTKAGQTEEEALLNARLAYILQNKDYDISTKEIKLWEPQTED